MSTLVRLTGMYRGKAYMELAEPVMENGQIRYDATYTFVITDEEPGWVVHIAPDGQPDIFRKLETG